MKDPGTMQSAHATQIRLMVLGLLPYTWKPERRAWYRAYDVIPIDFIEVESERNGVEGEVNADNGKYISHRNV